MHTTTPAPPAPRRRRPSARATIIALAIVSALITGGGIAGGVAIANQVNADAARATAARIALSDARRVLAIRLDTGRELAGEVAAVMKDNAPLLAAAADASKTATAASTSLSAAVTKGMPDKKTTRHALEQSTEKVEKLIAAVRHELPAMVTAANAAGQVRLDAATIADPAARQAVVDAQTALAGADNTRPGMDTAFARLTAALAAVEASQAAVVEAQRVAAEAAAQAAADAAAQQATGSTGKPKPRGGSSSGGSSGGGSTGGSTGGDSGGGASTPGVSHELLITLRTQATSCPSGLIATFEVGATYGSRIVVRNNWMTYSATDTGTGWLVSGTYCAG